MKNYVSWPLQVSATCAGVGGLEHSLVLGSSSPPRLIGQTRISVRAYAFCSMLISYHSIAQMC